MRHGVMLDNKLNKASWASVGHALCMQLYGMGQMRPVPVLAPPCLKHAKLSFAIDTCSHSHSARRYVCVTRQRTHTLARLSYCALLTAALRVAAHGIKVVKACAMASC